MQDDARSATGGSLLGQRDRMLAKVRAMLRAFAVENHIKVSMDPRLPGIVKDPSRLATVMPA